MVTAWIETITLWTGPTIIRDPTHNGDLPEQKLYTLNMALFGHPLSGALPITVTACTETVTLRTRPCLATLYQGPYP